MSGHGSDADLPNTDKSFCRLPLSGVIDLWLESKCRVRRF
jgi:hypothetical protein